jgi:hypothetical protein
MDERFFAWNLDINDSLTSTLTGQVIGVALFVAGICAIVSVAYNFLSSGFGKLVGGEGESFPNYQDLARTFVLILCISAYMPIAQIVVGTIETVNSMTAVNSMSNLERFYEMQQASQVPDIQEGEVVTEGEEQGKTFFGKAKDMLEGAVESGKEALDDAAGGLGKLITDIGNLITIMNPVNLGPLIIHIIAVFFSSIVKIVVTGIAVMMTKVLIILGPLAFAFSILPCFRKQLEQWFSTLVTTGMTLTTINILDAIINSVTGHLFANTLNADIMLENIASGQNIQIVAFDLVIIILYCSSFWLTSKVVGKGDAGRVLSKAVTLATTMAGIAITGAVAAGTGGTGGAAMAGSGSVSSAANAGKSIIDNGEE